MEREIRYTIVKRKDYDALISVGALTLKEQFIFNSVLDKIERFRELRGAEPLECVVVEKDWPEYSTVWDMIENRVASEIENIILE